LVYGRFSFAEYALAENSVTSMTIDPQKIYEQLGVANHQIIYIYSDLRALGPMLGEPGDKKTIVSKLMDPLLAMGKTILLPTFTYTSSGDFHVDKTPTQLGVLNKWILGMDGRVRGNHPLFSFAALGARASFLKQAGPSAFGHGSVFDLLRHEDVGFLHIGRPISFGNTLLHHVEDMGAAPYRFLKKFPTRVYENGAYLGTDYTAYLRRTDVEGHDFYTDFTKAAAAMKKAGFVREIGNEAELTHFSFYGFAETLAILQELFYTDSTIFLAKPHPF
jgi:aminoglycoside N3'-acetyltransferase